MEANDVCDDSANEKELNIHVDEELSDDERSFNSSIEYLEEDEEILNKILINEKSVRKSKVSDNSFANEDRKKCYFCNTCGKKFFSLHCHIKEFHQNEFIEIDDNEKSVHNDNDSDVCNNEKKNEVANNYETIVMNHTDSLFLDKKKKPEQQSYCLECKTVLKTPQDAEIHQCSKESSSLDLLAGVATNSFKNCKNEEKSDKNAVSKPIKCNECKARFYSSKSLAIHRRVHNISTDNVINNVIINKDLLQNPLKPESLTLQIPPKLQSSFRTSNNKSPTFTKTVENVLMYVCHKCNKYFSNWDELKLHTDEIHGQGSNKKSTVEKKDVTKTKLQSKHKKDPIVCEDCNETFHTKKSANEHKKTHHTTNKNDEDGLYLCEKCNTSFVTVKCLKLHSKMHKGNEANSFDKIISNEKIIEKSGNLSNLLFWCQLCEKFYDTVFKDIHEQAHKNDHQIICSICNKKFDNEIESKIHLKLHENHPKRRGITKAESAGITLPYECSYCGRQFQRAHEKVKHERIHTGEKPHKCYICGKCFRVQYCLTLHIRSHTDVRPYTCSVCNKRFKSASVYKHHMTSHSSERAYKCTECPKSFKTAVSLAGHRKSHTKPFTCAECNRPFSSLYAVKLHMETHKLPSTNLKHKCVVCGAVYVKIFALREHIKELHGNVEIIEGTFEYEQEQQDNSDYIILENASTHIEEQTRDIIEEIIF